MKKSIFALALVAMIGAALCSSCKCVGPKPEASLEIVPMVELSLENTVTADREYMFVHYGSSYRWYESCILLDEYMDAEECTGSIAGISNVFQSIEGEAPSFDTHVILFSYTREAHNMEVKHAFWVEDSPLNEEVINISYKEAYEKMMEANYPKPHSKHCVLRKEVGPYDCNAQYIFGNIEAQIYVDAVTGAVSDQSPAFNK